jgi:L-threonylcarbamoyladenylate synthase
MPRPQAGWPHAMKTTVLPTHTPGQFQSAVRQAVECLRAGEVVALPTETVYGLAANALNADAVAQIFHVKGRPAHNPIIVHIPSTDAAKQCVESWPALAGKLAAAFWPGPLTLVLPRAPEVPDIVTAGGNTVGVRWPNHRFIQAVMKECNFPLAAQSANLSNRVSPTTAEHVRQQLDGKLPLIVDGGACSVGIESTVLDLSSSPPKVLRPGIIPDASLASVLGTIAGAPSSSGHPEGPLRSPGLLRKHYAPKAMLVVLSYPDAADLRRQLQQRTAPGPDLPNPKTWHIIAHSTIPSPEGFGDVRVMPRDPIAFARALYAELHRCDELHAGLIIIESPPPSPEWDAIRDRLTKAAAG